MRRPMSDLLIRFIPTLVVIIVGTIFAMWSTGDIGLLQQSDVLNKARSRAGVPNDWMLTYTETDKLTVLLFTSPDGAQYNAQLYVDRTGVDGLRFKLGWFHAYGVSGTDAAEEQSIHAVQLQGQSLTAYFSANAMGAAVVRDPQGAVYTSLDASAPFTLVAPAGLVFEDADGNAVPVE